MKQLLAVLLLSVCALAQGLALPPMSDPFWQTPTGKAYIARYQNLKQCDARAIKNLRQTWPDVHCVNNRIGRGNHFEFTGKLYEEWLRDGCVSPEPTKEKK